MIRREANLSHGPLRFVDAGEGPVLLLLHGLGGDWRHWAANIPWLAERHRVFAVDLPGFGESQRFAGEVTMARYADVLIELLDHEGIDRATFVGNSMGGLVTIEAAARHPDRVGRAVLVCSGGVPLNGRRHRVVVPIAITLNRVLRNDRVRRAALTIGPLRRLIAAGIVHDPGAIDERHLAAALDGVLGAAEFARVLNAAKHHDARRLATQIRCPTLVLWGREDRLLPLSMGEELSALIDGSELVVWERTGHAPMLERPARFNELLSTFAVGEVPAGARS